MTLRTVTQYKCGFCKKRGLSSSHMATHERHCTMNPNRVCRVCLMTESIQKPMAELKALMPNHPRSYYEEIHDEDGVSFPHPNARTEVDAAMIKLREACLECPACTLAAIRQAGIPPWFVSDFDFKAEMKELWDEINNERAELEMERERHYG